MAVDQQEVMPQEPYEIVTEEPLTETAPKLTYTLETSQELAGAALSFDKENAFSEEKFDTSVRDLTNIGDSAYVNEVFTGLAEEKREIRETTLDAMLLDPTLSEEETDQAYFQYQLDSQFGVYPDIAEEQITRFAASTNATMEEVMAMHEATDSAIAELYGFSEEMDEESGFFDYAGMAIPFNYNKTLWGGYTAAFPDDSSLTDDIIGALAPGEMVEILVEKFQETPREEWPVKVEKLLQGMQESAGYFGVNQAILAEKSREIADKLTGQIELTDLDLVQFMDNAFGIADLAMAGGIVKSSAKFAYRYVPKSTAANVARANLEAASGLTAEAIRSSKVAAGAGTSQETAAYRGLHAKWDEADQYIEDGVADALNRNLDEANAVTRDALDELNTQRVYTDAEVQQVSANLKESIDKLAGVMHSPQNSTVKVVETEAGKQIDYSFTYVKGKNKLFDSPEEAIAAVKRQFPDANVKVNEVHMGTKKVTRDVGGEVPQETITRRVVEAVTQKINALSTAKLSTDDLVRLREAVKNLPTPQQRRSTTQALKEATNHAKHIATKIEAAEAKRAKSAEMLAKGTISRADHQKVVQEVQYLKSILDETKKVEAGLLEDAKTYKEAVQAQDSINQMGGLAKLRQEIKRGQGRVRASKDHEHLQSQLELAKAGKFDQMDTAFQRIASNASKSNAERETINEVRYGYSVDVTGSKVPSEVDKVMFGDNAILTGGEWMDWALDPASRFSRDIASFASRAVDKQAAWKNKLFNLTNSFVKLPVAGQRKVAEALVQGDQANKVWTVAELRSPTGDFRLNGKELEAYFAMRNIEDVSYILKDAAMAKELRNNGNLWYKVGEDNYAAKPLGEEAGILRAEQEVFDPILNAPRKMTTDEIKSLYSRGGTISKLDTSVLRGDSRMSNIVIDPTDGVRIGEVPRHGVLNKIEGHITRVYDETYYIKEVRDGRIDGEMKKDALTRVLRVAGSRKEANEIVAEMNAKSDGKRKYDWEYDRAITAGRKGELERELDLAQGVLKHAGRGQHLAADQGLARIENPIEAIRRATNSTAATITMDRMILDLENRWLKTFGQYTQGKMPRTSADLPVAQGKEAAQMQQAARMWNYIDMLKGNPTGWEKAWGNAFLKMGEFAENIPGLRNSLVQGSLDWLGRHSADKIIRGLAFNLFIALNPLRQLFLQSQQVFFLSGLEPVYMATKMPAHQSGFLGMMVAKKFGSDKLRAASAKALGMTPKEADDFLRYFEDSGLMQSVDQHAFARDGIIQAGANLSENLGKRAFGLVQSGLAKAMSPVRKVGFEAGEINNLMMTYLISYNRLKRANPKFNINKIQDREMLAYETRNLSLNMNNAGTMKYQRGWLGTATQFLSVQHKAILNMMPGKYGNKSLTNAEKLRILGGQVVLWGSSGVGLQEAYFAARDAFGAPENEQVDNFIQGGIAEMAINSMIQNITGDDTELSIASTYAAGSGFGNSVYELGKAFFNGTKAPADFVFGPSMNAINRVADVAHGVYYTENRTDLSVPEKLQEMAVQFASLSSGANNIIKMMMYKNLRAAVDASGNPIAEATLAEAIAKGVLGLDSKDVEDYYRVNNSKGGAGYAEIVDEEASRLFKYWKTELIRDVQMEAELGLNASFEDRRNYMLSVLLDKHDTMMKHSMALYDEDMALSVQEKLMDKLMADELELKQDSLYAEMVNTALKGTSGSPMKDMIIKIENSRLPAQQKEAYINLLNEAAIGLEYVKEDRNNG